MESAAQIGLFVTAFAGASIAIALYMRSFRNRRSAAPLGASDAVSLSDAARIAYRQAMVEQLAIAKSAEHRNSPDGALAWFERSIRQVVPATSDADASKVTRAELTRYMSWARTVQ